MKKIALAGILAIVAVTPVQGAGRDTWPTFEECVAYAESAGSGQDGTFTYVCSPAADGSWDLIWSRISGARERPAHRQGQLKRAGPR